MGLRVFFMLCLVFNLVAGVEASELNNHLSTDQSQPEMELKLGWNLYNLTPEQRIELHFILTKYNYIENKKNVAKLRDEYSDCLIREEDPSMIKDQLFKAIQNDLKQEEEMRKELKKLGLPINVYVRFSGAKHVKKKKDKFD